MTQDSLFDLAYDVLHHSGGWINESRLREAIAALIDNGLLAEPPTARGSERAALTADVLDAAVRWRRGARGRDVPARLEAPAHSMPPTERDLALKVDAWLQTEPDDPAAYSANNEPVATTRP